MLDSPDPRIALSWVIHDLHQRGWATGTGGNFSVVHQRNPLTLLMAPSGVDKGLVQPSDLIEVDRTGRVIQGMGNSSAETQLHQTIVETTGAGAVLHTHSVFNTVMSDYFASKGEIPIAGYEMLKGLEGIRTHDITIPIPIIPNSQDMQELSDRISPLLPQCPNGFLVAGHGLYAWGDNLFQARRHVEIWEFLLEVMYRKTTLNNA